MEQMCAWKRASKESGSEILLKQILIKISLMDHWWYKVYYNNQYVFVFLISISISKTDVTKTKIYSISHITYRYSKYPNNLHKTRRKKQVERKLFSWNYCMVGMYFKVIRVHVLKLWNIVYKEAYQHVSAIQN